MRQNIERAAEWLASKPWAFVAAIAIVVALPILLLGESSASDTQRRLHAERLTLGAQAAQRSAEDIQTQVSLALAQLRNFADDADLAAAIQLHDPSGAKLSLLNGGYGGGLTDVGAIDVVDPTGRVLATVTPSSGFSGAGATPAVATVADRGYFRVARAGTATATGIATEPLLLEHPVVVAVPIKPQNTSATVVGVLIGEIRGSDLARHLRSQLGSFEDLYIVDGAGLLVGRAAESAVAVSDLGGDPVMRSLMAGTQSGGELRNPTTGTVALLTSAPVTFASGAPWTVVVVQPTGGVEAETATALADQRDLRLLLVAVLLVGSYAFARIGARTLRQRSQLAVALGQVEAKSREVEIATRHKSEFLTNMSHELRTPLNAIIGFSDVLDQQMFGDVNAKQREYLDDIRSSGRHLLSLINDILDLSKVEAGKMELQLSRFSLPDALESMVTMVRERAAARDIRLTSDVDSGLGQIEADERKVKQIVLNLLTNAVKFTAPGGHVDLHAAGAADGVTVSIADTGVGIAPDDQARVFEEFAQARGGPTRDQEGTGLGLTLSRKFVELHGGRIWVESEIGKGSTFTFTLPRAR